MTEILLAGALGRMGRTITEIAAQQPQRYRIVGGIDRQTESRDFPLFESPQQVDLPCDVIVDFSGPQLLEPLIALASQGQIPLVLATTGYSAQQLDTIATAAETIPLFFSANMSLGINLLAELCKKASVILGADFDIEIIEKHHNQKLDAPSGTAILLADRINSVNANRYQYTTDRSQVREKRPQDQIGIHAVRGGTIVGEHEILFAGNDEVISLSHVAYSRSVFANGALKAAEFMKNKPPGLYTMKELVGEM